MEESKSFVIDDSSNEKSEDDEGAIGPENVDVIDSSNKLEQIQKLKEDIENKRSSLLNPSPQNSKKKRFAWFKPGGHISEIRMQTETDEGNFESFNLKKKVSDITMSSTSPIKLNKDDKSFFHQNSGIKSERGIGRNSFIDDSNENLNHQLSFRNGMLCKFVNAL